MSKKPIVIRAAFDECQVGEYVWEDGPQRHLWELGGWFPIMVASDQPADWATDPSPFVKRVTREFEPVVLGVPLDENRPGYPRSRPKMAWRRVK